MDFTYYPYLIWYLAMFFFWMLAIHRQILFWLYLWQLKEYHLGRFLAHFETKKGEGLFLGPLYLAKLALAASYTLIFSGGKDVVFVAAVFALFFFEFIRAAAGIVKMNFLRPTVTKKSLLLLITSHFIVFGFGFVVFDSLLGEMDFGDFGFAALLLLLVDVLLSLIAGLVVLVLQPLTVWQKRKILNEASGKIASYSGLTVIGVAGSYGKSVVKEMLAHVLEQRFKVLKTQANQNTEIGVAQAIINDLKPEHQIFVCEIGAVHKGRIKQVGEIVNPKIGILTGINQQHLGVFGSQKNIIDGKYELLEILPENGIAILNWNSNLIREGFEGRKDRIRAKNIVFCGKDIFAQDIKATTDRLSFIVKKGEEKYNIDVNARGAFMVEPILLVICGALAAGMNFGETIEILNHTDFTPFNIKTNLPETGTLEDNSRDQDSGKSIGFNIIDSTYSSNPDSVAAHLDYLKLWPGKKVIIMPCLIELGKESKKIHYEIGKKIAQVCDLAIITTGDRFEEIKTGATAAGMNPENIILSEDLSTIKELIKNRLNTGDVILMEGRIAKNIISEISKIDYKDRNLQDA